MGSKLIALAKIEVLSFFNATEAALYKKKKNGKCKVRIWPMNVKYFF